MTNIPDAALFSVNEKPREYTARVSVRGSITINIEADSKADAEAKARAEVDKMWDEGYVEVDDIDDMDISYLVKDRPLFRVTREGKPMQVSDLQAGDLPRDPDPSYGF